MKLRTYCTPEDRALHDTFQSEGKRSLKSWEKVVQLESLEQHGIATRPHSSMAGIFKNIQGLYGLTTKKAIEEIVGGATDSEATQSQNLEVVPL
ncbi:hypothetical protein Dimus_032062 [Dionaea muscipula]